MAHSGFEASAVTDMLRHPLKALSIAARGVRTDGAMAKDISVEHQRPADFVFSGHVERRLTELRAARPGAKTAVPAGQRPKALPAPDPCPAHGGKLARCGQQRRRAERHVPPR